MKKENTQQRLKHLMDERGLKQIKILRDSLPFQETLGIKMSKTHLSNYVNGKSQPDNQRLVLLARTLNVSEAWLMGYDVPRNNTVLKSSSVLQEITDISSKLEDERKKIVLETAKAQLNEQMSKEKNIIAINKIHDSSSDVLESYVAEKTPYYDSSKIKKTEPLDEPKN